MDCRLSDAARLRRSAVRRSAGAVERRDRARARLAEPTTQKPTVNGEHDGGSRGQAQVVVDRALVADDQAEPAAARMASADGHHHHHRATLVVTSRAVAAGVTTKATTSTVPTARTAATT